MGLDASPVEETAMNIFNIPNLLSLSRILAVPVFVILMLEKNPLHALVAGVVFSLASATDWLDGYLARRWGQVTKIGKLLDPVADKILIMSAMVVLVEIDVIRAWIAVVFIAREFAVTGLRSIAASEGIVIHAEKMGKLKVVAQTTAVIALVLNYYLNTTPLQYAGWCALGIAMVLSIYSAGQYFREYGKQLD
jgi:CDP-diacylglycerol---glycerol-3-phosphate 3-phosphatidyltransferase